MRWSWNQLLLKLQLQGAGHVSGDMAVSQAAPEPDVPALCRPHQVLWTQFMQGLVMWVGRQTLRSKGGGCRTGGGYCTPLQLSTCVPAQDRVGWLG